MLLIYLLSIALIIIAISNLERSSTIQEESIAIPVRVYDHKKSKNLY